METEKMAKAADAVLEVVMFENWLRFYFIAESDEDELKIAAPEKTLAKIGELYPELAPLAESLNDKPITFELSRNAVQTYALKYLEEKNLTGIEPAEVFSSRALQTKISLFNAWARLHEAGLDRQFLDFGAWRELFAKWLDGPGGRALAKKFADA